MEGFSSNLNDTFTSTRGCAEPMFFPQHILPLLPLYNAQWWGYESLTAIVLVWSRSLKLFHRNYHHIETTKFLACVQNLFGEHHPVRPAHVISYGLPIHETSVQALACPVWWFGHGMVLWTIPLCSSIKKCWWHCFHYNKIWFT